MGLRVFPICKYQVVCLNHCQPLGGPRACLSPPASLTWNLGALGKLWAMSRAGQRENHLGKYCLSLETTLLHTRPHFSFSGSQ